MEKTNSFYTHTIFDFFLPLIFLILLQAFIVDATGAVTAAATLLPLLVLPLLSFLVLVVVVIYCDDVIILVDFDTIISNAITSAIFSSNEMFRSLMSSYIG